MLKEIKLNNYKTFINDTLIDVSATNYKFLEKENVSKNRILKGLLFVGENASGKTNVIQSIKFLLDLLFGNNEIELYLSQSFYTDKKTYQLGYTFLINGKEIYYEIEFKNEKIASEKVILDDICIMERLGTTAKFYYENETKYIDDIAENLLSLRRIYFDTKFYNDKTLTQWFEYMRNSVYVNCYKKEVISYSKTPLLAHEYLNEHDVKGLNDLLDKIGYNHEIKYSKEPFTKNNFLVSSSTEKDKTIYFSKKSTNLFIPEQLESTGNITLVHLLPVFLHAIKKDCMVLIDEFSSGLHNELEEALLKYFFHYSKNSQVFVVSHSTNLLNTTLFRPDQIYSISFSPKEGSILKRFSTEMPRESQNLEKMYLNGVFDGVPKYNKIFKD